MRNRSICLPGRTNTRYAAMKPTTNTLSVPGRSSSRLPMAIALMATPIMASEMRRRIQSSMLNPHK